MLPYDHRWAIQKDAYIFGEASYSRLAPPYPPPSWVRGWKDSSELQPLHCSFLCLLSLRDFGHKILPVRLLGECLIFSKNRRVFEVRLFFGQIYIIYIYIYIYDKELFLCYTFPRYKRLTNLVQFFLLTVGVYVSLVFVCVCVCEVWLNLYKYCFLFVCFMWMSV